MASRTAVPSRTVAFVATLVRIRRRGRTGRCATWVRASEPRFRANNGRAANSPIANGDRGCLVARAVLVFHRIRRAVGLELDHVGLADQAQRIVPQRQRPLDPQPGAHLDAGLVDRAVYCLPTQRVQVVVERLLQMNEPTLARAVGPVLQGRKGDGVEVFHQAGV